MHHNRPVYNGPVTDSPLSVCALKCIILVYLFRISLWHFIFFRVALFSCCTLFIFHHLHIAFFYVEIFACCTFFRVILFLWMVLFHVALLHVVMFSFCIFLLLHSSHVAIFSCCTLFMLHYFHKGLARTLQTSEMESYSNSQ